MSIGEVKAVQRLLDGLGYSLGKWGVDGKYGATTYAATRKAQAALGVTVDGIAGPDTIAALKAARSPLRSRHGRLRSTDDTAGRRIPRSSVGAGARSMAGSARATSRTCASSSASRATTRSATSLAATTRSGTRSFPASGTTTPTTRDRTVCSFGRGKRRRS